MAGSTHERPTNVSNTYVALLRGINVGGNNKLPMKDLVQIFVVAGCRDVRSFIQSGNVIFSADPDLAPLLPTRITAQIAERFGFRVPVLLRTAHQLDGVIRDNPYRARGVDENTVYVLFLAGPPRQPDVATLDPNRSPPDTFIVLGQEIYLHLPEGAARSKLTNAYFDAKLATISTARNWRTVLKLRELMAG